MARLTDETEYLSASSSGGGGPWSPAPSSVDSEELQELLEELHILPRRDVAKRQLDSDGEADGSPSACRPHASPRLDASVAWEPASAAAVPPARRPPVATAIMPAANAAAQQRHVEVIELLDSSEDESEEELCIAAPGTARKRPVVDSDTEEEEGGSGGSSSSAALPLFFAAIPGLEQPAAPPAPRPLQPTQPQHQQQHAAPPPPRARAGAAQPPGDARPLSAAAFKKQREGLTAQLFQELNRTVFGGQLPAGLQIRWNARLLTTAGLTHYRREIPDDPYAPPIYSAHVELSSKVLDGFGKLERTLCHELCHVAAWLVDHTAKPPHGPVFKAWADKAMRLYSHLDITTCHAYEIFYPFRWQCTNGGCLQEYGRHSNSIDVAKKVCGACRCPLAFLGRFKADGTPAKPRSAAPSKFVAFVKENHAEIRAQLPAGTPQKAVMQHLAVKYAEARQRQQQLGGGGGDAAAGLATTCAV